MFRKLTEKEQRFYDECKIRGLEPFYNKMVQHSLTKEWTSYAPSTPTKKYIHHQTMKEFKTEIISLLEQYSQALPVTEFTDDEQWYFAVEICDTDSALLAAQSLIQDNLEEFRLGDISPYSYKGDMGSPMLLYKAKNNQGFGLLNSYLEAGEALDDFEPNPSVKELLRLTGRLRRSQAHEPSWKKLEFYINVTIPAETLMLENLALARTEINYVDEEYDGVYYFKNSEIGAAWQDVPESIYLMYALGKNPSPQFHPNTDWFARFSINPRSLNYPGGL